MISPARHREEARPRFGGETEFLWPLFVETTATSAAFVDLKLLAKTNSVEDHEVLEALAWLKDDVRCANENGKLVLSPFA